MARGINGNAECDQKKELKAEAHGEGNKWVAEAEMQLMPMFRLHTHVAYTLNKCNIEQNSNEI